MAVAILKNDFVRPGSGWWQPGAKRFDWNWLSERFDANKDGQIERDEFPKDIAQADQLLDRLDRDGRVAYKGGRGPFGYKPRELEQSLIMLLLDEATSK